jgi:hypothetical protein
MDLLTNIQRILLILLCQGLLSNAQAEGVWFTDPETGCRVYGEQDQPLVSVFWSGDCVDGRASGEGQLEILIDGIPFSTYQGEMRQGKAHGYGILASPDNSRYEGEFRNNRMHGQGVIISSDGKRLEGTYHEGLPHGTMTVVTPDGQSRQIEFQHGQRVK